jgi:FixJ family two-component response regulator
MKSAPTVLVVDDDPSIREAVANLLRSVDLEARTFASPQEFLSHPRPDGPSCLILDVRMPGLSGLDLQKALTQSHPGLPIIFITGHGDIPMTVTAMKAGAVEFLTKPFRDQELLDAVQTAIEKDRERLHRESAMNGVRKRYESLTVREREIFEMVVSGKLNKQAAAELGVSEITIKVHRGQVMRKMNAKTLADLLQMAGRLQHYAAAK